MTSNVVPADDDLVERLRATLENWAAADVRHLVNPDGPAAADRIASLSSELARCRNALEAIGTAYSVGKSAAYMARIAESTLSDAALNPIGERE